MRNLILNEGGNSQKKKKNRKHKDSDRAFYSALLTESQRGEKTIIGTQANTLFIIFFNKSVTKSVFPLFHSVSYTSQSINIPVRC